MADICTTSISDYIDRMGINISALSRGTGISDGILRRSIVRKERSLRFDEAIAICEFLGKDPFDFYRHPDPVSAGKTAYEEVRT